MNSPESLEASTLTQIIAFLDIDEAFLASNTIRERCDRAYRVLRDEYKPKISFSVIGYQSWTEALTKLAIYQPSYTQHMSLTLFYGRGKELSLSRVLLLTEVFCVQL
jgi:hypothetical protein